MKKVIMVMVIIAALSFLVSMIAVAPLVAVEASKTGPTPKQAPTKKTPPATQFSKNKVAVHTKFWDIYVLGCTIYHHVDKHFNPCGAVNPPTSIRIGDLFCRCVCGIKTPPVNEITELDVKTWGTGSGQGSFSGSLSHDDSQLRLQKTGYIKNLPQFTWADVQQWKSSAQGNAPRTLKSETIEFTLKPTQEYIGLNTFVFSVSTANEYDGTNNTCTGKIEITP